MRWLLTDHEDDLLQGISCEAQVMYMRVFRRYADFTTGRVSITHGLLKRVCEFIPDNGSADRPVRVADLTTHWVRARIAELERAGLIEKQPKQNRFEEPVFLVRFAVQESIRPEKEPQRNRKEGTASHEQDDTDTYDTGTAKEPQGRNRKIPGYLEEERSTVPERERGTSNARGTRLSLTACPAEWLDWARTERPDLDITRTWAMFSDHWAAQPGSKGCKTDWHATWRNWVRREDKPKHNGHDHGTRFEKPHHRIQREQFERVAAHDWSDGPPFEVG